MSNLSGKRVMLVRMEDPYTNLKSGDEGIIKGVDDMGHILVKWDNGSSLSLLPEIDEYEILESKKLSFLRTFESYRRNFTYHRTIEDSQYDSSIKEDVVDGIIDNLKRYQSSFIDVDIKNLDEIISNCEDRLAPYDKISREFIIDTVFYNEVEKNENNIKDEIISMGDKIMNKFGTEPRQVINAFEDIFSVLNRYISFEDEE